jgi:hypothetical protein
MAVAAAEVFFAGNASKETEQGMGVELNKDETMAGF